MFHTAKEKDILDGNITDVYFARTQEILKAKRIDKWVKAEFIAKSFPREIPWAVLAGIEETAEIFKQLSVTVRAMPEGTLFRTEEPVMEIGGQYSEFGHFETALIGLLCQASGIATQAARCKKISGDRPLISFGARRMHPALAPMIERSAFIGGCDGVAVIKSAELIGQQAVGTMPHALILLMGDTLEAVEAFDAVIDPSVKRVALIDTLNDEKCEALRVAEAMGKKLYAIRLDTPASRRGNLYKLIEELRWELALRGLEHIKIFVSGGLNEEAMTTLNPVVDAYGIGTAISNAPVIDFSMDIVEVEGRPFAKRGKKSASKQVYRCEACGFGAIVPASENKDRCPQCQGPYRGLLNPFIRKGELARPLPTPEAIRKFVLKQCLKYDL
ncbi:MAG: nicotinate phosphoribosyltransferase [Nitrospiria bacterium]